MTTLTRTDVERRIAEAREKGERPDLSWLDLSGLNLSEFDLSEADMSRTSLSNVVLCGANLTGVDFFGANLSRTIWDGLSIDGLHPSRYRCLLIPQPVGWLTGVGCWSGTVPGLRELIAGDKWPEARGGEIVHRRPMLAAWADLCDAHIAARPHVIEALAERWGDTPQAAAHGGAL